MREKKKLLFFVGLGLVALFFLVACSPTEEDPVQNTVIAPEDPSTEQTIPDAPSELEGVTMYAEQESYPVGTEEITVILENESDEEYYYGKEFHVEQDTENGWEEVPFEEEMAWIQIAIELPPGGQTEEPIDLTFFEQDLEPGRYRVVKQIAGEPLHAEFQIE